MVGTSKRILESVWARDGVCLYGLYMGAPCEGPLEVHHIEFRSQGGGHDLNNLILLCRSHHTLAQVRKISADFLRKILHFYSEMRICPLK